MQEPLHRKPLLIRERVCLRPKVWDQSLNRYHAQILETAEHLPVQQEAVPVHVTVLKMLLQLVPEQLIHAMANPGPVGLNSEIAATWSIQKGWSVVNQGHAFRALHHNEETAAARGQLASETFQATPSTLRPRAVAKQLLRLGMEHTGAENNKVVRPRDIICDVVDCVVLQSGRSRCLRDREIIIPNIKWLCRQVGSSRRLHTTIKDF
mmetsp:Transcript_58421/g.136859  ORF Transcript_58421/g.136859 Transcript_58421/m.136859 type:complete len:208 (+) Transcript_58421:238-861(+)